MHVDNKRKYILFTTLTCTYICFYTEPKDSKLRLYKLDISKQSVVSITPPFVHIFDNLTTAISISTSGSVYFWKDYTISSNSIQYQIPIISYDESITCVEYINDHILLGSSKGEIYLLKMENNSFTTYSIFMQKFRVRDLFTQRRIISVSNIEKSLFSINRIVSIYFKEGANHFYALTDKSIQSWKLQSNGELEFLSNTRIENEVRHSIEVLISDQVSKEGIRFDILNMSVHNDNEIVIIASYSIKELGDYVQYALISLRLKQDKPLKVLYTVSIPYSAIPSTLKYPPRLSVLKTMAFITFDSTVIAVSTTKSSTFEESVVLNEDEVLFTKTDETDDTARAIIFTLTSGVIHFEIDKKLVCATSELGNIYTTDDTVERDELVFKSKLEQAVFFGTRSEPLLQFFLRPEGQVDISKITMNLYNEISKGRCKFLPSTNRTALYVESRYLFVKKIAFVLNENHLLSVIPDDSRVKLMKQTELYYLAQVLYKSSFVSNSIMECWAEVINNSVIMNEDASVSCRSPLEDLVVNHTSKIVHFVQSYENSVKFNEDDKEDKVRVLENANILLMRMIRKSKTFEEKYKLLYSLKVEQVKSISDQFYDMLYNLYQTNILFIQKYSMSDMMESDCIEGIKKHVYDAGFLLLQPFHEKQE
ncbi:unnamed protein product [Mucor hiemalis]